ncbi:MAG: rhomboid family intramembrane serine protease, partial [Acidobacteria bacterium]|nr:rhomboid family intramembrane serine protease [Acidobacteriota bacterium]
MFDFPPPPERYELRPPKQRFVAVRRALFHAVAAWIVLLLVLNSQRADPVTDPIEPRTLLYGLGAALAWGLIVFLSHRPVTELPPIEITGDGLRGPFTAGGRRPFVPFRQLRIAHAWRHRGESRLVLGVEGGPAVGFPADAFTDPKDPQRIADSVRRRIAALPHGTEQLTAMDRRAEVAERVQTGKLPATWGVAAVLVLMYGLQVATGSLFDPLNDLALGANSSRLVLDGQWHRLFTANLLHAHPLHLGLNLWGLVLLGRLLEPLLGSWRWLTYFLLTCLAGATASALITRPWASLGASTGIAGLLGVYTVLIWSRRDDFPTAPSKIFWIALPAAFLIPAIVFNVDHAGHAGGLALGVALAALELHGQDLLELRHRRRLLMRILGASLAVLFVVFQVQAVAYAVSTPAQDRLSIYHGLLEDPATPAVIVNFSSWYTAVAPAASRSQLETARSAMERAVKDLEVAELEDTLATLDYRLGRFDDAIERELPLTRSSSPRAPFYRSQLTRFELA